MNTTVPLIGIFVVSKQKLNWPQSYLCFSCAHPKQDKHRPHIFYMSVWACSRRVFNSFNKYHAFCLVCRLMQIRKYDSNLKSRSSCIYVCERLKKMRTKLSRGESSDASPTAAAGWQGLLTAHRCWGTGISCYSPRYRETKKKRVLRQDWEVRKIPSFKMQFQKKSILKVILRKSDKPSHPVSVLFLFARYSLYL